MPRARRLIEVVYAQREMEGDEQALSGYVQARVKHLFDTLEPSGTNS